MVVTDRFKDAPWITNDRIIIGGAGGIGSWLILFLARIGYQIHVYDDDDYELHNMGGQFVDIKHVGISKVKALQELCSQFGTATISIHNKKFEYNTSKHQYMMAGFDNMKARKDMFNTWFDYCKDHNIKDALFIDGRLLFEQIQIFCVTPTTTKEYRDNYLFDDSEVADEVCTLKQTSHSAALIAGFMTSFFTNHITNVLTGNKARAVPFKFEYFIPLNMMSDV